MKLEDKLSALVAELDRVHPNGLVDRDAYNLNDGDSLLNFVTSENGNERHFTRFAQKALRGVAGVLYKNWSEISSVIDEEKFFSLVRQSVADVHDTDETGLDKNLFKKRLIEVIKSRLGEVGRTYTHYFPAWTLGVEKENPVVLGPVSIMTVDQWLCSVDFPPGAVDQGETCGEPFDWKSALRCILEEHSRTKNADVSQQNRLVKRLYFAVRDCPSILKVEVPGCEIDLSRKIGEMVCKSALDSISLLLGQRDCFYQQALRHEHLPPLSTSTLLEADGYLWCPGSEYGPRVNVQSPTVVRDFVFEPDKTEQLECIGKILNAFIYPNSSAHPNLAKRWLTALDWFSDGQRERNDFVSLAKLGTSLDVLACGGKSWGIAKMLSNFLQRSEWAPIFEGNETLTIKGAVEKIYEQGRSQILHGSEIDRIKSFESTNRLASLLCRIALLTAATRLGKYYGSDDGAAFRSMKP